MYVVGLLQGMESLLLPVLLGINSRIVRDEDQGEFKIFPLKMVMESLPRYCISEVAYPGGI